MSLTERIDKAFDFVAYWRDEPEVIDLRLSDMLVADLLEPEVAIAWLTATLPLKSKLPFRPMYFKAVVKKLQQMNHNPDDVLHGLA